MKKLYGILKSFLITPFIIYIFDTMAVGVDLYIPVNIATIVIVGLLGVPGFIMLVLLLLVFFGGG